MKKVDRLLLKAAAAIEGFSFVLFPADDDLFIEALGVDPEKYKHISRDGKVGYDFLAALSEIAAETWDVPMADSLVDQDVGPDPEELGKANEREMENMLLGLWRDV